MTLEGKEKLKHLRERENLKDLDIKGAFKALKHYKNKAGIAEKIINKKDESEMVLIPAGPFLYGSFVIFSNHLSGEKRNPVTQRAHPVSRHYGLLLQVRYNNPRAG